MEYYGLSGTFLAQPGKRGDLIAILLQAAVLLQKNPDCIHYLIGTTDDPDAVWVGETWTTKQAHDDSLAPQEVRALIMQARPLIASMSPGTEAVIVGGKGLNK